MNVSAQVPAGSSTEVSDSEETPVLYEAVKKKGVECFRDFSERIDEMLSKDFHIRAQRFRMHTCPGCHGDRVRKQKDILFAVVRSLVEKNLLERSEIQFKQRKTFFTRRVVSELDCEATLNSML